MTLRLGSFIPNKNHHKIGSWLDARCKGAKDVTYFPDDREYSHGYMSYFKDVEHNHDINPGSNRSNAYYLKEVLINSMKEFDEDPINLPYMNNMNDMNNMKKSIYSMCGDFGLCVSEQSIYHFIFSVSTSDHNTHKYTDKTYRDDFTEYAQKGIMYKYIDFFSDALDLNIEPDYEIEESNIKKLSNHIKNEMMRLLDFTKYIWDTIILPFIYSNDCVILDYLSDRDYWIFEEFIKSSSIYYIMDKMLSEINDKI